MRALSPKSLRHAGELLRGLWLKPLLMALAGVALGIVLPLVDAIPDVYAQLSLGWLGALLESSPSGARAVLSTGAGALATILGVAFSLTLVTLQLAASQYTTRVIGRFMDDGVTKLVLGTYVGTVAYLLLVLRSVRGADEDASVPRLSLSLGILLILVCLALLAYFIHHLGTLIEAPSVVAAIGRRTLSRLERTERERPEGPDGSDAPPGHPVHLAAPHPGYVQIIDPDRLARACRTRAHVRVDAAPGAFVVPGTSLASIWPDRPLDPQERQGLLEAIAIGHSRTEDADVLLGVQRLSDVALIALSPGVNDETTAIIAVNELGAVLLAIAQVASVRDGSQAHRRDGVTVTIPRLAFERALEQALQGVCRFSADHPRVLAQIAYVLAAIVAQVPRPGVRDEILRAAGWIEAAAERGHLSSEERRLVSSRVEALRSARLAVPEATSEATEERTVH